MLVSPLDGCIWAPAAEWPGMARLLQVPGENLREIEKIPGLASRTAGSSRVLYAPISALEAGRRPALLMGYPPDIREVTPTAQVLKDHQRRTVTAIRSVTSERAGIIVGAAPGLGKSIMALQANELDGLLETPGVILAPLAARGTWCSDRSDALLHYGLEVQPLEGMTPDPTLLQGDPGKPGRRDRRGLWVFLHYQILPAWMPFLRNVLKPRALIVDESHFCMNPAAQWTGDAITLSANPRIVRRTLLTGTPIPKTRMDLWSQLAIAQPHQWGKSHYAYGIRYMGGVKQTYEGGKGHFVFEDPTNTEELRARLAGVYLRYTADSIPGLLPDLQRIPINAVLDQTLMQPYWEAQMGTAKAFKRQRTGQAATFAVGNMRFDFEEEGPAETSGSGGAQQLKVLNALTSLLEKAKVPYAIEYILALLTSCPRVVVFTWTREVAASLAKALSAVVGSVLNVIGPVDGAVAQDRREKCAREFMLADRAVIVCTRGAVGVSINELCAAGDSVHTSLDWNPSGNLQVEKRLHRMGTIHTTVRCHYLLAPGTVDEIYFQKLIFKAQEAVQVSPADLEGMAMVDDLLPQHTMGGSGADVDEICQLLATMED